jgi:putative transposase
LRKLLKKPGQAPLLLIIDKQKSDIVGKRAMIPGIEHCRHKSLSNRAENLGQPMLRA